MSSYSIPGIQRPPFLTGSSSSFGVSQSATSQHLHQVHRSSPLRTSTESIYGPPSAPLGPFEPAAKRQKGADGRQDIVESGEDDARPLSSLPEQTNRYHEQTQPPLSTPTDSSSQWPTASLAPFPSRPAPAASRRAELASSERNVLPRESVQAKPYTLEIPKTAPRYHSGDPADFFPWTGNYPEDALNEHTTKTGFYDKLQITQNEAGSARAAIWPNIKHKSGLQILSSLFVSALEQRQAHGTVNLKCNFKPPPRVTLTDTKREAWLKDLADPNIPLRRLSRTIPHGIKGRLLLDHCLAKDIPTWRAVWLAKCVGANEIRAFRRKGVGGVAVCGGESAWIKDWTANVEQFVERLIQDCGQQDWKRKMTNGLQLTFHIYSEHLIDQDHFLDWMINAFNDANSDTLPIWLLIIQIFLDDLPIYRRRGKSLALAISEQLCKVANYDVDEVRLSLWKQLAVTATSLMRTHTACFFFPSQWPKYAKTLEACTVEQNASIQAYRQIAHRNFSFALHIGTPPDKALSPRQQILKLLDELRPNFVLSELKLACLEISHDYELLINTLFQWATTKYRSGYYRIYVVVRLLRSWTKDGFDLNDPVLDFLGNYAAEAGLDKLQTFRLVSELVRSRHFSVGKYLQWLMARGPSLGRGFELELLNNIPLYHLPDHVLNLRKIVLTSSGSLVKENENARAIEEYLIRSIKVLANESNLSSHSESHLTSWKGLSLSVAEIFELSHWFRQGLVSCIDVKAQFRSKKQPKDNSLSLTDFELIYEILDHFRDYAVLADVLGILVGSGDEGFLRPVTEVIVLHFKEFHAIGASNDLFRKLLKRIAQSPGRVPPDKPLLLALIDLGEQLGEKKALSTLRTELALLEPKSAFAAYSPVSDHVAEALQSADSSFLEEVEVMLNSGTSMDRPLLLRMFEDVTKRLEAVWFDDGPALGSLFDILARLKPFDHDLFDRLMRDWFSKILFYTSRPGLTSIFYHLAYTASMTLGAAIECFVARSKELGKTSVDLTVEVVEILAAEESLEIFSLPRVSRYAIEVDKVEKDGPRTVASLLSMLVELSNSGDQTIRAKVSALMKKPGVLDLLKHLVLSNDALIELRKCFAIPSSPVEAAQMLDRALDLGLSDANESVSEALRQLFRVANVFNVKLCRLKLTTLFDTMVWEGDEGEVEDLAVVVAEESALAGQRSPEVLQELLQEVPSGTLTKCHENLVTTLMSSMPDLKSYPADCSPVARRQDDLNSLLGTIAALNHLVPPDSSFVQLSKISDMLDSIRDFPAFSIDSSIEEKGSSGLDVRSEDLRTWMDISLRSLSIYQNTFQHPTVSQNILLRLVLPLSQVLASHSYSHDLILSTRIHDTLALISDSLSDESRLHCVSLLRKHGIASDSGLRFLLGTSQDEEDSFLAVSSGIGSSRSDAILSEEPRGKAVPFPLRRWELVQDATPSIGENDCSISLSLFGARKAT